MIWQRVRGSASVVPRCSLPKLSTSGAAGFRRGNGHRSGGGAGQGQGGSGAADRALPGATCYTQVIEQPTGRGADIRAEMVQEHGVKKTVLAYEAADEFRIKQGMKRPIEARSVELNRAASQVSVEPSVRA